jgi:hypothetical protein
MLGITPKRLFILVFLGSLLYVAIQYIPVLFYALEFDDFVKDEVKFAPMRETDDPQHLTQHILNEARYYKMILDKNDIQVTKTRDNARGVTFLAVDVDYRMPVDLYYFTHEVRFHRHASTVY